MKAERPTISDKSRTCAGVQRSSFIVNRSDGYAFVVLMVACTIMLIALAAALPSIYHESRREKEEELIFRGNEYARAIYLFQRQLQRYPKSIDELIRTNNIRFLRHAYKDPMSPNGKWRFIHVGPGGVLVDSLTMGPQQQPQLAGAFGQSPRGPFQSSSSPSGTQDQQGAQDAQGDQREKPKVRPGCEDTNSESAFFSSDQVQGALIAGVASCSSKTSIRVYNKKTKYEEWEFLGVAFQTMGFPGVSQPQPQPQQPGSGAPGTTQPGQTGGFGGSTPTGVQPPQDTPLTDQPVPVQPQEPQGSQDSPPQP